MNKQPRYILKEYTLFYQVWDTVDDVSVCNGQNHGIMMGLCEILNSTERG